MFVEYDERPKSSKALFTWQQHAAAAPLGAPIAPRGDRSPCDHILASRPLDEFIPTKRRLFSMRETLLNEGIHEERQRSLF